MRKSLIMMALYGGLAAAAYFGFINLLTGFVPIEDQGYLMISAQLPDASSLQRTGKLVNKVTKQLEKTAGVASWISVIGYSILDGSAAPNGAAVGVISDARFQPDPRCITDGFSAAKQRFRPILMTAISSILGGLPLVVASGARSRQPPGGGNRGLWRHGGGHLLECAVRAGVLCGDPADKRGPQEKAARSGLEAHQLRRGTSGSRHIPAAA